MLRVLFAFALGATGFTRASAQTQGEGGAFVVRLGTDTIAVERYRRSAGRLECEAVTRSPETSVQRLTVTWDGQGRVNGIEVAARAPSTPPDAPPDRRTVISFGGDSATVEATQGGTTRTRRVPGRPEMVPIVGSCYAAYEILIERARRAREDSASVDVFTTGGPVSFVVRNVGRDSVVVTDPRRGPWHVRVDGRGRIQGLSAEGTTFGIVVARVASVDLEALAQRYAALDAQGRGLGMLSPRDTARATVGGAQILVDYGRPAKRGRQIFGGVVPWNQVWRTGANQSTHFHTDRDLRMGDATIPAGTYTLWTLPSPDGWKLIVSQKTGQWGTEYDETQDLARLDLRVDALPEVVERFTISVEERDGGGVLKLAWDRTQAWIAFDVQESAGGL